MTFSFDKQLIFDMGVQMDHELAEQSGGQLTKKCCVCSKVVKMENMREHIAAHILKHDVSG